MIEVKTFKQYLRSYNIPYAYNRTTLYVPACDKYDRDCFWAFSIKCGIITDDYMLLDMPNVSVKKCYNKTKWHWEQQRLNVAKCDMIRKFMHTSYNHTVEQMIIAC